MACSSYGDHGRHRKGMGKGKDMGTEREGKEYRRGEGEANWAPILAKRARLSDQ